MKIFDGNTWQQTQSWIISSTINLLLGKKHKVSNNFSESHGLSWNKSVDSCVGDTKAKVSKTVVTLAWIKTLALNCTISLCIPHCTINTTTSTPFTKGCPWWSCKSCWILLKLNSLHILIHLFNTSAWQNGKHLCCILK